MRLMILSSEVYVTYIFNRRVKLVGACAIVVWSAMDYASPKFPLVSLSDFIVFRFWFVYQSMFDAFARMISFSFFSRL